MNFKNTLRKEISDKLKTLDNKDKLSENITKNITGLPLWEKCSKLFIFISFKDEVDTKSIINNAIKDCKKVYAPVIKDKHMSFYRIDNLLESELVKSSYGILEPPKGLIECFPDEQSIIVIPGVAFTPSGDRMGRGGGYYDRYLSKNRVKNRVAITFETQLRDKIPIDVWDIKMNTVVTEKNIYGGI